MVIRRSAVAYASAMLVLGGLFTNVGPAATAVATPAISAPPDRVVGEFDGTILLPVTLSDAGTSTVTVAYSTPPISAGNGALCDADYLAASGTLTFTPGQTSQDVAVTLHDCPDTEGLESFQLVLSGQTNSTIARSITRVDIVDNDRAIATPPLFIRDAVVDEAAGAINVPVMLGGPTGVVSTGSTVTVAYTTNPGTATAGSDYTTTSGTLQFLVGQTVQNIVVPITNDADPESSERFTVTLSSPTGGGTIVNGDRSATVVIGASDAGTVTTPAISAPPDVVVGEADGYVDLPITLSAPTNGLVTVMYAIQPIGAASDVHCTADFTGNNNIKITFLPNETTKVVRTDLLDCPDIEGIESFQLSLSLQSANATIARSVTRVDIIDNDNGSATPPLFIRDAVVDEGAGTINVPVLLGGPGGRASTSGTVTVHYATSNSTATAGSDYTTLGGNLTFALGQTVQNITIPITERWQPGTGRAIRHYPHQPDRWRNDRRWQGGRRHWRQRRGFGDHARDLCSARCPRRRGRRLRRSADLPQRTGQRHRDGLLPDRRTHGGGRHVLPERLHERHEHEDQLPPGRYDQGRPVRSV